MGMELLKFTTYIISEQTFVVKSTISFGLLGLSQIMTSPCMRLAPALLFVVEHIVDIILKCIVGSVHRSG